MNRENHSKGQINRAISSVVGIVKFHSQTVIERLDGAFRVSRRAEETTNGLDIPGELVFVSYGFASFYVIPTNIRCFIPKIHRAVLVALSNRDTRDGLIRSIGINFQFGAHSVRFCIQESPCKVDGKMDDV